MRSLIVIPARYASSRLPGKPLLPIRGVSLLHRTIKVASLAAEKSGASYVVATDDERIVKHAQAVNAPAVLTSADLPSGSDRALAAAEVLDTNPDFIVNLQGDVPFTPPGHVVALIAAAEADHFADAYTPVIQLSWDELDRMREQKKRAAFSGTTCVLSPDGRALWFSKSIIPALRNEAKLRENSPSPVFRHIGMYGYRLDGLRRFVSMRPSHYEKLEGLEQLRLLEAGMTIRAAKVSSPRISMWGIDTQADVASAESLLTLHPDPFVTGEYE